MEPGGSKQDAGVVKNMTRAMEALSPWLNHPRRTIIQVEALVVAAAALLLLQLILGTCRRKWHNAFIKYGLQVCNGIMFPLIVYTLGTMQSSPIKNSAYPVWTVFLIMASAGTTAVRQHGFYESAYKQYFLFCVECSRDFFYVAMFLLLTEPRPFHTDNLKRAWDLKWRMRDYRASTISVQTLLGVVLVTKLCESGCLVISGYKTKDSLFITKKKSYRAQDAEHDSDAEYDSDAEHDSDAEYDSDAEHDSDPQSMKGYKYTVCKLYGDKLITIDRIWDCCANSPDLKDLCLSYALSWQLRQRYFGRAFATTSHHKDQDFVFKHLLPSGEEYFQVQRAFRVIEVELGFCYDFFFTKYHYTFSLMKTPYGLIILTYILLKLILILVVGMFAIRKSLVLQTPNPIIEIHISEADYIITLLVLSIAFLVELVQAAFYLASNWVQVLLACMHVKGSENIAYIFEKIIGFLRWAVMISQKLRNKIDQHSFIFPPKQKQQPGPVEVSDAVKKAIARSLRSTYANLSTNTNEEMLGEYSWTLNNLSELEVILILHIATEYCNGIPDGPINGSGTTPNSNARGVAVHLSRYCAYLIRSVPELLPYHEVDIAELTQQVMEEHKELYKSCCDCELSEIYNVMKSLPQIQYNPTPMFDKGVMLGKQLERKPDKDRWEVLQDFWSKKIIHAAAAHYTTKQHMQHLENGGEFLTHIWALLAHAGILSLNRNKNQEGQTNPGSDPSAAV